MNDFAWNGFKLIRLDVQILDVFLSNVLRVYDHHVGCCYRNFARIAKLCVGIVPEKANGKRGLR